MKQHSRLKQFSFPTAIFYFLLYFAAKKRKPIQWQIRVIQCDFFRTPSIDAQEETVGGCEQKIEQNTNTSLQQAAASKAFTLEETLIKSSTGTIGSQKGFGDQLPCYSEFYL